MNISDQFLNKTLREAALLFILYSWWKKMAVLMECLIRKLFLNVVKTLKEAPIK